MKQLLASIFFAALAATPLMAREPNLNKSSGVVTGGDRFKIVPVSPIDGWVQAGIYDSREGLEIAALDYGKITFLDRKTFAVMRTIRVNDDRIAYKELVSLHANGKLNLMAPGGGYSDVGLFDLQGKELWKFRPRKELPPDKMIAEDLDHDGTKEFYVADMSGVYRLDSDGKVVWHVKSGGTSGNHSLFALPAEGKRPACVVTEAGMWDSTGKQLLPEIKGPSDNYRLRGVKWGNSIHLVSGQDSAEGGHFFVFDLAGNVVFRQTNGGCGAVDFFTVRFKAGELPSLVVIGRKQGWRGVEGMSIFAHDGTLLYRDVHENENFVVVPDQPKGQDTLLLCTGGIRKFVEL